MINEEKFNEIVKMVHSWNNGKTPKPLPEIERGHAIAALIRNETELMNLEPLTKVLREKEIPVTDLTELVAALQGIDVQNLCEIIKAVRCCKEVVKCENTP